MKFKLKCKECPAIAWHPGIIEEDVNATVLDDDKEIEWEPEISNSCKHEDFDIVDQEYDTDED